MPPKKTQDTGNEINLSPKTTQRANQNNSIAPTVQQRQIPNGQKRYRDNGDDFIKEIQALEERVLAVPLPKDLLQRAMRSIDRLRIMAKRGSYTGDYETIEKYIHWITGIPWGNTTRDNLNIENAKQEMDASHYGLETVKQLILDYLAVMQLRKDDQQEEAGNSGVDQMAVARGSYANAPVMLFVGLQGVGKTSIAKSIARAMGRKFIRVSLGAIGSVQMLRGQSRALPDSEPGQIIKSLVRTGSMNPIILLDEIDKASGNKALLSDIMAALLEILDPEQNSSFVDHYIDYPVNLSRVFFICTANNLGTISTALLDRMEVIRFTSYSDEEKEVIAKNYSMPKILENMGVDPSQLIIDDNVWPILIRPVGFDAGLRQLERNLSTLVRRVARRILEGSEVPVHVTTDNIREFVLPDQGPLS